MLIIVVEQREPLSVIIHHASNSIQEEPSLLVLVNRRRAENILLGDHRMQVLDILLARIDVSQSIRLAPHVLDKEPFTVVSPPLVNPHIRAVARRDAVAEPLMCALMHDDEVESRPDAGFWSSQIAILEVVAVGDCGLIFNAGV